MTLPICGNLAERHQLLVCMPLLLMPLGGIGLPLLGEVLVPLGMGLTHFLPVLLYSRAWSQPTFLACFFLYHAIALLWSQPVMTGWGLGLFCPLRLLCLTCSSSLKPQALPVSASLPQHCPFCEFTCFLVCLALLESKKLILVAFLFPNLTVCCTQLAFNRCLLN
jgi:hypothetical protein